MDFAPSAVWFLSSLTLLGQVIAFIVLITYVVEHMRKRTTAMGRFVSRHALLLMFIVALTATSGSLFFSEIAGWTPCKDCWLQRIFMYPQVVLLGIALWRRDRSLGLYLLALCIIGGILSVDHYADQVEAALAPVKDIADPLKPCDASGVSCAKTEIHFTFGYITIPMMALTAFVLNALGSLALMRHPRNA